MVNMFLAKFGHGADTTQLSCQDSEHNGYVLKCIEQNMSDQKSVKPKESWDGSMEAFARERLCRAFVHDVVMKDWKYRYNFPASKRKSRASRKLNMEGACTWCNQPATSLEHKAFCGHVLFEPILEAANTGKWPAVIENLLKSPDARDEMTSASCRDTRKPQRQNRSFTTRSRLPPRRARKSEEGGLPR